jgi:2,3-bisphosphoglycerate-independent phosphoglycerate mutase
MVDVLIILDGASEAPESSPSSLELARTPALDRLAAEGERSSVQLLPPGVPVGSETGIAALLGWTPDGPVERGALEAAARGITLAPNEHVWRVDIGMRPGRHRLLAIGDGEPPVIEAAVPVRVWPDAARPPRILDERTVVIGAAGAATGLARLMGARAIIPDGATGRPGSDLAAKREAALAAIADGAERVVVHIGGPDEAAHEHDRALKIAVIEAADRELIGPLAAAVAEHGGSIRVCPDHGCDPETGDHVGGPVPSVTWASARVAA